MCARAAEHSELRGIQPDRRGEDRDEHGDLRTGAVTGLSRGLAVGIDTGQARQETTTVEDRRVRSPVRVPLHLVVLAAWGRAIRRTMANGDREVRPRNRRRGRMALLSPRLGLPSGRTGKTVLSKALVRRGKR